MLSALINCVNELEFRLIVKLLNAITGKKDAAWGGLYRRQIPHLTRVIRCVRYRAAVAGTQNMATLPARDAQKYEQFHFND